MEKTELGPFFTASRISVRAVVAGAVVALCLASMFVLLAGFFGLLPTGAVDTAAIRDLGPAFGSWAIGAWVVASFAGAWLASVISRSSRTRDGLVHGVVTWAVTLFTGGLLIWMRLMVAFAVAAVPKDILDTMRTREMYIGLFFAYLLTLAAALVGGAAGARSEVKSLTREPLEARRPIRPESTTTMPPYPQPT